MIPRFVWRREIDACDGVLPWGWGVAWLCIDRDAVVAMPIPLNVIAGGIRAAWWFLQAPPWRWFTARLEFERVRGYREGYEDGLQHGRFDRLISDELRREPLLAFRR